MQMRYLFWGTFTLQGPDLSVTPEEVCPNARLFLT
jgi:hypothetical protein